jgi:hypothetical protein
MDHYLIPPILIWGAGLYVDETPKSQVGLPTIDNHVIVDLESGMQIHLALNGIFSYFPMRSLTVEEVEDWEDFPVVFITPDGDGWDPYASHFAENEVAMIDANGLIVEHDTRLPWVLFTEADLCKLYGKPVAWDKFNDAVDRAITSHDCDPGCPLTDDEAIKLNHDGIRAGLASIDISYEPRLFAAVIAEQAHMSHVSISVGSISIDDSACDIFEANLSAQLDTAFAMTAAVSAGRSKGVNAELFAKVWCIPHDEAAQTLKVTTQSLQHDPDSSLSRNVGTNNRAVRYRKIKSFFFSDTLFVTGTGKSSQGNICAQLFVSDKGFVAIYPMTKQSDYFLALKQFAKDVGAPDVLVCDPHPAQTKREVREFCTQIGTTLKVLEAETQWANRAGLYIGLIKKPCARICQ